jgi:hypothetical protein
MAPLRADAHSVRGASGRGSQVQVKSQSRAPAPCSLPRRLSRSTVVTLHHLPTALLVRQGSPAPPGSSGSLALTCSVCNPPSLSLLPIRFTVLSRLAASSVAPRNEGVREWRGEAAGSFVCVCVCVCQPLSRKSGALSYRDSHWERAIFPARRLYVCCYVVWTTHPSHTNSAWY